MPNGVLLPQHCIKHKLVFYHFASLNSFKLTTDHTFRFWLRMMWGSLVLGDCADRLVARQLLHFFSLNEYKGSLNGVKQRMSLKIPKFTGKRTSLSRKLRTTHFIVLSILSFRTARKGVFPRGRSPPNLAENTQHWSLAHQDTKHFQWNILHFTYSLCES